MEDIYNFIISEDEFAKVLDGLKIVHLYVNDKKHKALASGNVISFVCGEGETKKQADAVIENILYFPTVTDAVEGLGKEKCGFKSSQTFEKASDIFLTNESYEQIEKYGIGAILFKLNDKN